MTYRKLGYIKDKEDSRDLQLSFKKLEPIQTVYLYHKYKFPAVYDQGNLGSCTANAISFLVNFDILNKNYQKPVSAFYPSRLFIYYYERLLEGTVNSDSGAEIRDGIKVLAKYGAPKETSWPYDIEKFNIAPSEDSIKEALNFEAVIYQRIDNSNKQLLVNALLSGYPIVFGMIVFNSFMTDEVASTGIVPMPKAGEGIAGGHALAIVGYDTRWDAFIVRNSWGKEWGQGGYCRIPASYITSRGLCMDFWTVNLIK
jgi:C1A family cysteine protease